MNEVLNAYFNILPVDYLLKMFGFGILSLLLYSIKRILI